MYGIAVTAVVSGTFSIAQGAVSLVVSVVAAIGIGLAAAAIGVLAWRVTRDDLLQLVISIMLPYIAYLPALHFGVSGVLAVVTSGLAVNRYTPRVLLPGARDRATGFWSSIVFVLNAFIFVLVGLQFHTIVEHFARISPWQLFGYAVAVCVTVIVVRLLWVFGQGLLPETNEPSTKKARRTGRTCSSSRGRACAAASRSPPRSRSRSRPTRTRSRTAT